ncbi:WecB/TagA/CpsF family glycosyltransferase [Gynuella sp.]|uniref:WecB/TagA/CpsF family glycosyltransferase n=1 Tax=Gynuella sp. TaxID=2969146 RepID=UPI003D0A9382
MEVRSDHPLLTRNVWCVFGLPFDAVSLEEASDHIYSAVQSGKKCFFSTPNLNFAVTAQSDETFFESVIDSDLSLADGMPIIWLARILNIPLIERVAGSNVFSRLSERAGHKKVKVFFFGGMSGIAKTAHEKLNDSSQGMESCGYLDPGFVPVEDMSRPEIIETINNAEADFIVVALGAKKGQQWIQENREKLQAPVISHLGAVINFVAGHIQRAPLFFQKTGLEWLWRILQEPTLWKRYWTDGSRFLTYITTRAIPLALLDRRLRRKDALGKSGSVSVEGLEKLIILLKGDIRSPDLSEIRKAFVSCLNREGDVCVDFKECTYIDSAFIALLLLFQSFLKQENRVLELCNLPSDIHKLIRLSGVSERFDIV